MLAGFSRIGNVASFVGVSCGLVERETKYRGTSPPILANAPRRHRQMDKQVCRSLTCQQPSQKKNTALHQWRIISILQPCHRVLTLQILSTLANIWNQACLRCQSVKAPDKDQRDASEGNQLKQQCCAHHLDQDRNCVPIAKLFKHIQAIKAY